MSSVAPGRDDEGSTVEALGGEDQKLLTLAKSARTRVQATEGAAIRDETGRSYASCAVTLPTLQLTALEAAVAQAYAAGANGVEAALVVLEAEAGSPNLDAVADLGGSGVPVFAVRFDEVGGVAVLSQTST